MNHDLQGKLEELAGLDRPALARRWLDVFGFPAPRGCHAPFLRRALAWRLQMAVPGSPGQGRHKQVLKRLSKGDGMAFSSSGASPGTRLLREWQGQTHQVTVLSCGFEYRGREYRSLSAVARQITGTQWSGPQFFGLRS